MRNSSAPLLRIGICGSAGVGKTTLALALAREWRLPYLSEEMRKHLEDSGVDLNALPPREVESVLQLLWRKRSEKERKHRAFVADTCPIDFVAHALYYGCLSEDNAEMLLQATLRNLELYDAVILLPWGVTPYEQDGVRASNRYLQLRYHFLVEGLLRRYVPQHKLHVLPSTLTEFDDRLCWAIARFGVEDRTRTQITSREQTGKVYLVGAGSGDPRLLTLRAAELLRQADVVAYDLLVSPELLAQIPGDVELLPVGRRNGTGEVEYRFHPAAMARARSGKVVVRLKCGDPLLFGRGGEEAEELREAGISFEIVPGISAAFGAAAYAGIPLTQRGAASELLITSGHQGSAENASYHLDQQPIAEERRTSVLYMAAHRLLENLARLNRDGYPPTTPAALVFSATTPRQEVVVGTLATLGQQLGDIRRRAPAILIVGDVVSLRKKIHWFETDQLRNRRILVARAREGESTIARLLRLLGAEVVESPIIVTLPVENARELDASLAQLSAYDAVVFCCEAGVRAVVARAACQKNNSPMIAIGKQTAAAMRAVGMVPVATIDGSCAKALAEHAALFLDKKLLLFTSSEGRPGLVEELNQLGAHVDSAAAYRVTQQLEKACMDRQFDLVVLPNSTAAHNLFAQASAEIQQLPAVAMGPHTMAAAQQIGMTSVVCAAHDDIDSVVSTVVQVLTAPAHAGQNENYAEVNR